ncbi:hypothetical protein MTBLM5_50077 [Magnetospirillum sp. LM-5]|nr:hypothetical protein MTBLM5_50077 [Magnetospirillum sp. LM-5]
MGRWYPVRFRSVGRVVRLLPVGERWQRRQQPGRRNHHLAGFGQVQPEPGRGRPGHCRLGRVRRRRLEGRHWRRQPQRRLGRHDRSVAVVLIERFDTKLGKGGFGRPFFLPGRRMTVLLPIRHRVTKIDVAVHRRG